MFERSATGIALGADGTVRAAELTATLRTVVLSRTAVYKPESPDVQQSWKAGIRRAAEEGFAMSSVVVGAPDSMAYRKSLVFPFRNRSRIMQILQTEMEGEIPLAAGTFVADYLNGPMGDEGLCVMALAVEKDIVSRVLEAAVGVAEVRGIQTPGVGVVSAILRAGIEEGVVVWISGSEAAVLEVRSSLPSGMRRHTLTGEEGRDAALLAESVAQVSRVGDRVILVGGGISDTLATILEGEGLPGVGRGLDPGIVPEQGASSSQIRDFLDCIGMALKGIGSKGSVSFDLMQGPFLRGLPTDGFRGPMIRTALIALVTLTIAVGSLALRFDRARDGYQSASALLKSEFTDLFPGTRVVNEIAQTTEKLEELNRRSDILAGLTGGSALSAFARLSSLVPDDIALRLDEFSYDSRKLRLEGSVSSFDAVDKVKSSLDEDPMFSDVQVQNARVGADINKVSFRLVMEVR